MDPNVQAVISKHAERASRGMKKYGVTTERGDLSFLDWMKHLQEELMDAAVYIERLIQEGDKVQKASETIADLMDERRALLKRLEEDVRVDAIGSVFSPRSPDLEEISPFAVS